MAITDWPRRRAAAREAAGAGRRRRCPTPSCSRSSCAPACGARARSTSARELLARFGSLSALFAADADGDDRAMSRPRRGEVRAAAGGAGDGAARAARGDASAATRSSSPQAVRDYLRLKLQDRPHEVFVGVFLDAQNRVLGGRGALPRHADPDQRLSARGREARAPAQRRRGDLRAQPSVGRRRAQPRRRGAHAGAEAGARAGGRQGARPFRRRRGARRCRSPSAGCSRRSQVEQVVESKPHSPPIMPRLSAIRAGALSMARVCQVTGKKPAGGQPRFPRQQQDQAALPAQPAVSPLLGREREPLGAACASTSAGLRTIDKKGIDVVLAEMRARGEI